MTDELEDDLGFTDEMPYEDEEGNAPNVVPDIWEDGEQVTTSQGDWQEPGSTGNQEPAAPERPAWLPEGYDTPEQFVQATQQSQEQAQNWARITQIAQQDPEFARALTDRLFGHQGQAAQGQQSGNPFRPDGKPVNWFDRDSANSWFAWMNANPEAAMSDIHNHFSKPFQQRVEQYATNVNQQLQNMWQRLQDFETKTQYGDKIPTLPPVLKSKVDAGQMDVKTAVEIAEQLSANQQASAQVEQNRQQQQRAAPSRPNGRNRMSQGKVKDPKDLEGYEETMEYINSLKPKG